MHVALVSPPLVHQRGDPFGGIPAMPTGLAYLASWLRERGIDVSLIDAFGEDPGATLPFLSLIHISEPTRPY